MSASYQPVLWNRQKRIYDLLIILFVLLYLFVFVSANLFFYPEVTEETLVIRSTATLAIIILHFILMIGPLARLNKFFLPLLYNRRHLGVSMFIIGSVHGVFSIIQFHALGNVNPLISVFASNKHFESLTKFPFQTLGFCALIIFFLMAITSHDFWLNALSPRVWKTLHMFVYLAYALILGHVLLGVLQYETSPVLAVLLALGMVTVISLHILAGMGEAIHEKEIPTNEASGLLRVSYLHEIPEGRAKVVPLRKERIAIFKYGNKVSAVSNVCKHQNGPLGEGKIVDGCITCPWHGYQYLPHNGCSPPPFKEKVATYDVFLINDEVWVNPNPYPEGTERPPAIITELINKPERV